MSAFAPKQKPGELRICLLRRCLKKIISEIIGLIPREALADASAAQLRISNFSRERLIEHHIGAGDQDLETTGQSHQIKLR